MISIFPLHCLFAGSVVWLFRWAKTWTELLKVAVALSVNYLTPLFIALIKSNNRQFMTYIHVLVTIGGQLRNPSSKSVVSPRKNSGTERVNQNVGRDISISLHLFLELSLSFFCQTAFTAKGISTLAAISPFIVMWTLYWGERIEEFSEN